MFIIPIPDTYKPDDLFDAWVVAAHDAEVAWSAWRASAVAGRADAYASYHASLDREEYAATMLATALRDRHSHAPGPVRRFTSRQPAWR